MKEFIVKTEQLSKYYHDNAVLQDITISLEAGKIYGLIGQNGAGKTTLMRLMSGLAFPSSGTIELYGQTGTINQQAERKRMGCMIEWPSIIPYMTAKENLRYHRITRGIPRESMEEELLELVGLHNTGHKKAKNFSLGMKQRLGIAIALLGDPEFIILDEPVNGLDPLGVVEVREILSKLCVERNMTILISSHNLPELYQVATDYIIIHKGKILKTLTQEELSEECRQHIYIQCNQPEKLVSVLEMDLKTDNYKVMPNKAVKLYDYLEQKEKVATTIFENDIIVTDFFTQGDTLENYFINTIGGADHD